MCVKTNRERMRGMKKVGSVKNGSVAKRKKESEVEVQSL